LEFGLFSGPLVFVTGGPFWFRKRLPAGAFPISIREKGHLMARISLSGSLRCGADDIATVLAALPDHIRLSRAEAGCLSFEVSQDAANRGLFHVSESFVDQAAFDAHQTRTRASAWWQATQAFPRDFTVSKT
jgi:quinol monooxygenase YgiN